MVISRDALLVAGGEGANVRYGEMGRSWREMCYVCSGIFAAPLAGRKVDFPVVPRSDAFPICYPNTHETVDLPSYITYMYI